MMDRGALTDMIEAAWEARDAIGPQTVGDARTAVAEALRLLDQGEARVAEPDGQGGWRVNQWLKKAVLLSFRLHDMELIPGGPGTASWWDKVPSKFSAWSASNFRAAG